MNYYYALSRRSSATVGAIALLSMAVGALCLAQATRPATPQSAGASGQSLENERAQLLQVLAERRTKLYKDDPLFAEALERRARTTYDGYASKYAVLWLSKRAKTDPKASSNYEHVKIVYTLSTLLKMPDERGGPEFVRAAVIGPSSLRLPEVADEIVRLVPGTDRASLTDGEKLYATLTAAPHAGMLKAEVAKEVAKLPEVLQWPEDVLKPIAAETDANVRNVVYQAFEKSRMPKDTADIVKRLADINAQIDAGR